MSSMRNGKKAPGIRTQVILGFVVFTAMVVALLWFFQIGLLNTFYKVIKINEIRVLSNRVVEMLDEGAGVSDFVRISHDTNVSILVTSADGSNISMTPNVQGGILDGLSNRDCRRLFEQVQAAGGFVLQDNIGEEDTDAPFAQVSSGPDMICARTVHLGQKGDYLVMLSSSIIPVSSTVETLKVQLWCLTFTMLFMGFVLAMFIATRLSRPLERINDSAKQLAAGSYGIRFPEQGAREVAELAGTLNYASAELSRVEDLRRELLANVSHDLRTPLTMISGYAEIMRDLPGENTPENVQVIIDEAQRLTGLVNDMLDLSRLQAGVQTFSPELYCFTDEIRATLSRYDKLAEYTFRFWCDRDVYVYADRLKLSQVVYNLVSNAINYAGEDKTVYLRQFAEGNTVRLEVSDTGAGIPADKLPYVWERYYKVDKAHRRAQVGTGLGLSIVKNVLDMHGGRYGVISREGEGSTFWFELPVCMPPADHTEPNGEMQ